MCADLCEEWNAQDVDDLPKYELDDKLRQVGKWKLGKIVLSSSIHWQHSNLVSSSWHAERAEAHIMIESLRQVSVQQHQSSTGHLMCDELSINALLTRPSKGADEDGHQTPDFVKAGNEGNATIPAAFP